MTKFLLVIVVCCYCALCAQAAASKETADHNTLNIHNSHSIEDTSHPQDDRFRSEAPYSYNEEASSYLKKQQGRRKDKIDDLLDDASDGASQQTIEVKRRKRHAHHHEAHVDNEDDNDISESSQLFVRKLFQRFGDADQLTMNVVGFEKMLKHLGLYRLIEDDLTNDDSLSPPSESSSTTKNDRKSEPTKADNQTVRMTCEM